MALLLVAVSVENLPVQDPGLAIAGFDCTLVDEAAEHEVEVADLVAGGFDPVPRAEDEPDGNDPGKTYSAAVRREMERIERNQTTPASFPCGGGRCRPPEGVDRPGLEPWLGLWRPQLPPRNGADGGHHQAHGRDRATPRQHHRAPSAWFPAPAKGSPFAEPAGIREPAGDAPRPLTVRSSEGPGLELGLDAHQATVSLANPDWLNWSPLIMAS